MRINKHDTQGTKPLLGKGELGYDDYAAGGDVGRVWVGTGTENIPVAKKAEVDAVDSKADAHIARVDNPHGVTKAQVGLGLVDNTADASKNVLSATKWTTARTIALSGDVAGSVSMDGSANVSITTTIQPNSVALGTDTTGNYVAGATAGTGISISGTAGEGWSPTITNTAPNVTTNITTTHNATNVVVNSSDGTNGTINGVTQTLAGVMTATDKVKLDSIATGATSNTGTVTSIATSGAITGGTITSTGTISHSTADGFLHVPATGTTNSGRVLTAGATAGSLSWTALPSAPVTSVAGKTGVVTLAKDDVGLGSVDNTADSTKNVLSATMLTTARTINGVSFDGTANITVSDATAVKLTGDQTVAGVKTFSSSPIVPTPTANTHAVNKEYVDSFPLLPIGTILNGYTIFSNCIVAFGGEFNRSDYPKLWAYVQANPSLVKTQAQWQTEATANGGICGFYSSGNGTTTFRVPNLDKAFLRADSRGVGSYQKDGIANHEHREFYIGALGSGYSFSCGNGSNPSSAGVSSISPASHDNNISNGLRNRSTTNSVSDTRPINIAILPLIVAK